LRDIWIVGDIWISRIDIVAWLILIVTAAACFFGAPLIWIILLSSIIAVFTIIHMVISYKAYSRLNEEEAERRRKSNINIGLFFLIMFSPMCLAITAMSRFYIVDWEWPILVAATIGLPIAYMQCRIIGGKGMPWFSAALTTTFFCYSGSGSLIWSLLLFTNAIGNPDLIGVHQSTIVALEMQRGRGPTAFWANFSDPPKLNGITDFKMDWQIYSQLAVGETACVKIRRGNLSLRWYTVTKC
jgi:hypothetical protein